MIYDIVASGKFLMVYVLLSNMLVFTTSQAIALVSKHAITSMDEDLTALKGIGSDLWFFKV